MKFNAAPAFSEPTHAVLHAFEEIRALTAQRAALRREYGPAAEPFDVCVSCSDVFDIDGYRRLQDLGVTSVLTVPWVLYGAERTQLDAKRAGLERFANEFIARM
jgi:hypothetical protein